jgi:hypothetical protein
MVISHEMISSQEVSSLADYYRASGRESHKHIQCRVALLPFSQKSDNVLHGYRW